MREEYNLTPDMLGKVYDVFNSNNWIIQDKNGKYESLFNRYCARLSIFEEEEKELILELTRHYKIIEGKEYLPILLKILDDIKKKMNGDDLDSIKKFYLLPLLSASMYGKTKSSKFVWYYSRSKEVKFHPIFEDKSVVYYDVDKFHLLSRIKDNEVVVLLDDYIGTGETAIAAIENIIYGYHVSCDNIFVISIAAQKKGLENISDRTHVKVFVNQILKRGISDMYSGEQLEKYTRLMTSIEDKIKIKDNNKFGFKRSEGLISMVRTPNNTFPVFWYKRKKDIVPFPRC